MPILPTFSFSLSLPLHFPFSCSPLRMLLHPSYFRQAFVLYELVSELEHATPEQTTQCIQQVTYTQTIRPQKQTKNNNKKPKKKSKKKPKKQKTKNKKQAQCLDVNSHFQRLAAAHVFVEPDPDQALQAYTNLLTSYPSNDSASSPLLSSFFSFLSSSPPSYPLLTPIFTR